jgi:signal transduction histidine kinase
MTSSEAQTAGMSTAVTDTLLEQALHAQVLQRCRSALLHEIRNGLQPMHAGLEALSRVTAMTPFPLEKAQRYLALVRQASSSQEIALERAIERIAPDNTALQSVDLAALLREVTRFLSSDAAVAGVRLQLDTPATAYVHAKPHQLRLIALSLTLDAIEQSGAEGQLTISAHPMDDRVLLQFSDTRKPPGELDAHAPPTEALPGGEQFHLHVIRRLVALLQGETDSMSAPGSGYIVAITLPGAEPESSS